MRPTPERTLIGRILLTVALTVAVSGCQHNGKLASSRNQQNSNSASIISRGPVMTKGDDSPDSESTRTDESSDNNPAASEDGNARPQELIGKWCYMSNVNASSGGRISNRCFTLYEDGTYQYYAETNSGGEYGSSATQESDTGTWSATQNTITANSQSNGTHTYSLEKRNHPKTNDPMLVLDGDAYVTYGPKPPW